MADQVSDDLVAKQHVVLITDPMCSWCWGMAEQFKKAQATLGDRVTFELMLGGINIHGTQLIGDYGRRFLMKLWREVAQTTGQEFGFKLPDEYVHNSSLACMAIEVVRDHVGEAPFDYLHALQERFFVRGENINDLDLLAELAEPFGVDAQMLAAKVREQSIVERVRFQFNNAGAFGTNAMPSLLIERQNRLHLLAGGFVDAQMLGELLEEVCDHRPEPIHVDQK